MYSFIKKSLILFFILAASVFLAGCDSPTNEKKIGIIVPIEHQAMDDIVAGFKETLAETYPYPVNIKVVNAQGDLNLQRALIQQLRDEKVDIIAPIGTDATQMTLAMVKQIPIVSLAANISEADRTKLTSCHLALVQDEISTAELLRFIHTAYPQLTQLLLIHSAAEKIFAEVNEAVLAGKANGITVKTKMVSALNELYSTAQQLPPNTQGILVLKDHLIVSGISTLGITAAKQHIPLITSDQGSVQAAAAFALGVHEREIGMGGAKLAAAILSGKSACDLPIVKMTNYTVFINKASLQQEQQALNPIQIAANKFHYAIEATGDQQHV